MTTTAFQNFEVQLRHFYEIAEINLTSFTGSRQLTDAFQSLELRTGAATDRVLFKLFCNLLAVFSAEVDAAPSALLMRKALLKNGYTFAELFKMPATALTEISKLPEVSALLRTPTAQSLESALLVVSQVFFSSNEQKRALEYAYAAQNCLQYAQFQPSDTIFKKVFKYHDGAYIAFFLRNLHVDFLMGLFNFSTLQAQEYLFHLFQDAQASSDIFQLFSKHLPVELAQLFLESSLLSKSCCSLKLDVRRIQSFLEELICRPMVFYDYSAAVLQPIFPFLFQSLLEIPAQSRHLLYAYLIEEAPTPIRQLFEAEDTMKTVMTGAVSIDQQQFFRELLETCIQTNDVSTFEKACVGNLTKIRRQACQALSRNSLAFLPMLLKKAACQPELKDMWTQMFRGLLYSGMPVPASLLAKLRGIVSEDLFADCRQLTILSTKLSLLSASSLERCITLREATLRSKVLSDALMTATQLKTMTDRFLQESR